MVEDVPGEARPGFPVPGVHATVRVGGVTKFVTELVIILVAPAHPNDNKWCAEEFTVPQAEQRRQQLTMGQRPRGAENDQGKRLRDLHGKNRRSTYLPRRLGLNDF